MSGRARRHKSLFEQLRGEAVRSFVRWLPTFVAFPIGGWIAVETVGSIEGPGSGALAGLVAGVVIGAAQWLALRPVGIGARWVVYTALGMAVGTAAAAAITGAATSVPALTLTGLVTGAFVGAFQGLVLARGRQAAAVWVFIVCLAWGLGWLVTANVIVDADRGYAAFGSSGAILATVVTGLALNRLLAPRPRADASADPDSQGVWLG